MRTNRRATPARARRGLVGEPDVQDLECGIRGARAPRPGRPPRVAHELASHRHRPVLDGAQRPRLRAARHQLVRHNELGTHWSESW